METMKFNESDVVDARVTGVCYFSVSYGCPQGGAEVPNNGPRVDPDTGRAFLNPQAITRKLRDTFKGVGHPIFVDRGAFLDDVYAEECKSLGYDESQFESDETPGEEPKSDKKGKKDKKGNGKKNLRLGKDEQGNILRHMTRKYIDIRFFGQVLPKPVPMGVTGPVRISFSESVDPVSLIDYAPTRVAGIGKEKGMGRSTVIRFGLIRFTVTIDPSQAKATGFTWGDFRLLQKGLNGMFERTTSSTRSEVAMEKQVWFYHSNELGSYPVSKLKRRVKATLKDEEKPGISVDDYEITVDEKGLPDEIKTEILD
jgi:CRISPR-associated protein Csd2